MPIPSPTKKQARILWLSVTALAIAVLLALISVLAIGVGWMAKTLSPVLLPLAVAGILAFLLDPVVGFFISKGVPRTRSILLVFFIAAMAVVFVLSILLPRAIYPARAAIEQLSGKLETFGDHVGDPELQDHWNELKSTGFMDADSWKDFLEALKRHSATESTSTNQLALENGGGEGVDFPPSALETNLTGEAAAPSNRAPPETSTWSLPLGDIFTNLQDVLIKAGLRFLILVGDWLAQQGQRVASWMGLMVGMALVPVYLFYFLMEKHGIRDQWTNYLPLQESKFKEEAVFVIQAFNEHMIVFFRGQILVAMCVGALLSIGFSIIGLKFALLLGAAAGVLSIVPYLGVMLSILPAMTISFVYSDGWLQPILVIVVFILVQMAEGLVISPKIIGDRVGLHPLTIIVAVMIGTTLLGGIVGGVLAIPLTAALKVLMFRYVWKRPAAA